MLGEKIFEMESKAMGRRILPGNVPGEVKIEVSFQGTGKVFGIETFDMGTFESRIKAPGVLQCVGQGLSLTKEGEAITWYGTGIGKRTGKGIAAHWAGSLYYSTQIRDLARLNTMQIVFEWDLDENNNSKATTWEWK